MGPAHSTVKNQTENRICVITFTYTDLIYLTYNTLYVIEPGSTVLVESQPDATGLKVGLVYDCLLDTKEIFYQRFVCKTESCLTISEIDGEEISWFGENITGYTKGKIKEANKMPLTMAYEAIQNVEPSVGHQNGKFEKEIIKRVISEAKEKKNEAKGILSDHIIESLPDSKNSSRHGNGVGGGGSSSSSAHPSANKQLKVDDRSVNEKWEQEQERILQAAQKEQGRLADNKASLLDALAKVVAEEELARDMERRKADEERSEKARQREADKIRREKELDDVMESKKGKKRKNKKANDEGGCIIV